MREIEYGFNKHRLLINDTIIKRFNKYLYHSEQGEAGGVLLGSVYEDRSEIIDITAPSQYDSFGFNYFIRSKYGAQPKINNAWSKSEGTIIYLGEWHTHPEKNPIPSSIDKSMILKSLYTTKMEIDFLFLIIIGLENTYWVGKQIKNVLIELRKLN